MSNKEEQRYEEEDAWREACINDNKLILRRINMTDSLVIISIMLNLASLFLFVAKGLK